MKAILVNYNYTPNWLFDYDFDYTIFDRSDSRDWLKDFPQERVVYTQNIGNVDFDKLSYLIGNYDNLPEVFLWGKTNLFKYIPRDEFDSLRLDGFTPLLTQNHKTYSDRISPVCYYENGMYYERNDSWYLHQDRPHYFTNWKDWSVEMGLPNPAYIPFPPGGNFILTRERVQRYSVDLYEKMRDILAYTTLPPEAHLCERSYYLLWR